VKKVAPGGSGKKMKFQTVHNRLATIHVNAARSLHHKVGREWHWSSLADHPVEVHGVVVHHGAWLTCTDTAAEAGHGHCSSRCGGDI